jgi:hypothetical protein
MGSAPPKGGYDRGRGARVAHLPRPPQTTAGSGTPSSRGPPRGSTSLSTPSTTSSSAQSEWGGGGGLGGGGGGSGSEWEGVRGSGRCG